MQQKMTMHPMLMILIGTLPALFIMFSSASTNSPAEKDYAFDVQVSGQGNSSIIFIPGFASSGDVWDETKAKFEKTNTCYTLTMAGFAGTKPQPGSTFKKWEQSIAQFIQENNIQKPIVIGHSMGGVMALALAADYPELIGKIVVVDALPCLAAMNNPAFQSVEKPECAPMATQMKSLDDEHFRQMQKMTARTLVADTSRINTIVDWSVRSDRTTMGEMFCDFLNTDMRASLKNIQCPSLVLLQPTFKNLSKSIEAQYQNLGTANLQYANKGLHFIMYDDTQWYLNQIERFLASK